MTNRFTQSLSYILIALAFLSLVTLNNQLFSSARIDLTENKVYSLSDGSKNIVDDIEEQVNLYFFFSDKISEGLTGIRNYANRVKSLLQEYELNSQGKIKLHIIDPEPFSEAEDLAAEFGLTAAPIGTVGDNLYFGLGGRNALDDEENISFFDPQQEAFLEYEISKLIYKLANPEKVKVAIISGLPIEGGQNPMTGQGSPALTFYTQLQQLYDVELIAAGSDAVPEDTTVLMVIHPQNLSDNLLYEIDQYVMDGGKLITFVDPHAESNPSGMGMANSSDLAMLFDQWGIIYDSSQVVLDAATGLEIRTPTGAITRHPGYMGVGSELIDSDDIITAGLEIINGASFGSIAVDDEKDLVITPLLKASEYSKKTDAFSYAMTRDPSQLMKDFAAVDEEFVLAGRITGKLSSAFEGNLPEGVNEETHLNEIDDAQLLIVADTDLLTDRFWVQTANFFGQSIATPFANNGDFVTNAVENLAGSKDLISVRSRGTSTRPFTVVQDLTVVAEQRFREKEQQLQAQLAETERKLSELQSQPMDGNALVLTPEQESAIEEFMQQKLQIRKELRDVRHQLDKDIEALGSWLKFINIGLMPALMAILLIFIGRALRKTQLSV